MITTHFLKLLNIKLVCRFLYWMKNTNKKHITELQAQNKLEKFRKQNKNYLYPSFDTIAGTGKNGAIVHYRAKPDNCRGRFHKDRASDLKETYTRTEILIAS